MRIGIISDVHANLEALESVLKELKKRQVDQVWCLGDVVGYGPNPHECIQKLQEVKASVIAGNHDLGVCGKMKIDWFNAQAAWVIDWTKDNLPKKDIQWLKTLPLMRVNSDFTMVHGSPSMPSMEYVFDSPTARKNLKYFQTPWCLNGHTHDPLAIAFDDWGRSGVFDINNRDVHITREERLFINPGSVGQTRDWDSRASYMVYDSRAHLIVHRRVDYPYEITQDKMDDLLFPLGLIYRLKPEKKYQFKYNMVDEGE
jgi:predicted phosphodiesterase